MKPVIRVTIDTTRLQRYTAEVHGRLAEAVSDTAAAVVETAQGNAPVGSEAYEDEFGVHPGALRDSIGIHNDEGGGSDLEAVVGDGVDYGRWVHDGAQGRPGRPFLAEAVIGETPAFEVRLRKALEDA